MYRWTTHSHFECNNKFTLVASLDCLMPFMIVFQDQLIQRVKSETLFYISDGEHNVLSVSLVFNVMNLLTFYLFFGSSQKPRGLGRRPLMFSVIQ